MIWTRGRASRAAERKARSARLRAVEGPQGGRGRIVGLPWGAGRPGWHIECSAMAESCLGVGFDIHGGGSDLLFPHHENEAAQTRAARGAELARIWMHNGMIQFTGEKMAKSVGNIALLHEMLERVWPRGGGDVSDLRALPPAAGVLRGGARAGADADVNRIREAGRLGPGRPARDPADRAHLDSCRLAFFDALADRLQHAAGALASAVRVATCSANHRAAFGGDADLREMLGCWGSEIAAAGSRRHVRRPPEVTAAGRRASDARSRARLRGRRPPAR